MLGRIFQTYFSGVVHTKEKEFGERHNFCDEKCHRIYELENKLDIWDRRELWIR